jgi:hypothetical protein
MPNVSLQPTADFGNHSPANDQAIDSCKVMYGRGYGFYGLVPRDEQWKRGGVAWTIKHDQPASRLSPLRPPVAARQLLSAAVIPSAGEGPEARNRRHPGRGTSRPGRARFLASAAARLRSE